jgi:DNA replication protein DnaC
MNADVKQKMMPNNYLKKIKILIIDDLGAEMVSK